MTATTPGALLPTIRSRCRVLHLAPLAHAEMKDILAARRSRICRRTRSRLDRASGGSAGFALKILRSGTLPLYR